MVTSILGKNFIKNLIFFTKKFQQPLILVHIWYQISNFEVKSKIWDKFWRKWQLWPKNVISQIFQSLYNFIFILAIDDGDPPKTATATLTVIVEDINDNSPRFLKNYRPVLPEHSPPRKVVEVLATDDDDRSKGNGPSFTFRMDPNAQDVIRASFKVRVFSSKNVLNYLNLWYWNYKNIVLMKYFHQKISLKKCKILHYIMAEEISRFMTILSIF